MPSFRQDVAALRGPTITSAGYMRADAYVARVGVQEYREPDGSVRRELRLPEEVFHADALESFSGVPVTDDHPPAMLSPENARQHARGNLGEPRPEGNFLRAPMVVTDAALIAKMKAGKTQISCGYTCDLEMSPGEWRGKPYDAIQRNIRGNHVAVVDVGRAGPEVRARMDAFLEGLREDAKDPSGEAGLPHPRDGASRISQTDGHDAVKERPMRKIKIDGVEYEVTEQVAQALDKEREAQAAREKTMKADADKATARADQAEGDLAKERAARKDAEDPAKLREKIAARVALEQVAAKHLGADAKLDAMSDREVKVAVIKKLAGADLGADRSDDYVAARFDAAVGDVGAQSLDAARAAAERASSAAAERPDLKARKDADEHARNLWKSPIPGAAQKGKE